MLSRCSNALMEQYSTVRPRAKNLKNFLAGYIKIKACSINSI